MKPCTCTYGLPPMKRDCPKHGHLIRNVEDEPLRTAAKPSSANTAIAHQNIADDVCDELCEALGAVDDYDRDDLRKSATPIILRALRQVAPTDAESAQETLRQVLDMALDEVWFMFRDRTSFPPKLTCCMCSATVDQEHSDSCYYHKLAAIDATLRNSGEEGK